MLVVEDELLIALEIEAILSAAGFLVLGPASCNAEALRLIDTEPFEGALLDANLGGNAVDDVVERLAANRIPFAFVSGYEREALPKGFRNAPLVRKPFNDQKLLQAARQFAD